MTPTQERQFWSTFEKVLAHDDGRAAKSHLAAGRPIHYCDDRYPNGIVRKWPDGRRELVSIDNTGIVTVIQPL